MRVLVTGGAGFIGSAVVRHILETTNFEVGVVDKMGYASDIKNAPILDNPRVTFFDFDLVLPFKTNSMIEDFDPHIIMHLAAESHVDGSIAAPSEFVYANVIGTLNLLEAVRNRSKSLIMFHHVSTDEVYGDLNDREEADAKFKETDAYDPSSPYSASKAASDHLVRAWNRTYKIPTVITNCSNNYGPYHYPEKLIPAVITSALTGNPIRIYGEGKQVRDWLYVEDHAKALFKVATEGKNGETYNIGGCNEKTNLEVIGAILSLLKEKTGKDYSHLVKHVTDRPGHDLRYAIDPTKIMETLNWKPEETFDTGIEKTVQWYLDNQEWWKDKV